MLTARSVVVAAALVAAGAPVLAAEPVAAGRVKVASGEVFILRSREQVPARPGQVVFESDSLRTGDDGRIGITLKDDTRISLGPRSEARIDRFVYEPAEGRLAFVLNVVRGVAAYVSGRIAKLAPDSVRLETPAAIVGVRGTTLALQVLPE
jgi:hypothetical protein